MSLPKRTTVIRRLAAWSTLRIGHDTHPSAYCLKFSVRNYCRPRAYNHPLPPRADASKCLCQSCAAHHVPKFDAIPKRPTDLVVFSVDARGLGAKLPRLLALLVDIEPDILGV